MKLAKKARLRFDRHAGRWMIMYPERGLALNESGALIAQKLDGTRTLEQIVTELVAEHGAAEADIHAFIAELEKKGLVER
jgi:coenzyme PQQ biosynthesis protein PqqD